MPRKKVNARHQPLKPRTKPQDASEVNRSDSTPILRLPFEILQLVAGCLDSYDLKALRLTCRALSEFSTSQLFTHIRPLHAPGNGMHNHSLHSLIQSPCGQYMRSLDIDFGYHQQHVPRPELDVIEYGVPATAATRLGRVEQFRFKNMEGAAHQYLRSHRALAYIRNALLAMHGLRRLSISSSNFDCILPSHGAISFPKLTTLVLNLVTGSHQALETLIRASSDSLEDLDIRRRHEIGSLCPERFYKALLETKSLARVRITSLEVENGGMEAQWPYYAVELLCRAKGGSMGSETYYNATIWVNAAMAEKMQPADTIPSRFMFSAYPVWLCQRYYDW